MIDKIIKNNIIFHLYVVFSILGIIMMFQEQNLSRLFLSFGLSSNVIAFGMFCAPDINVAFRIFAGVWCLLLTLGGISVYANMLLKKKVIPICIVILMDTVVVFLWEVYALITNNMYGFEYYLPDLIVSVVITILVYNIYLPITEKGKRGRTIHIERKQR